jgi:hypothetical protein
MKKIAFVPLIIALGVVPASAQPLQQQLSRCLAIPGVLQRLNCYDSVAKGAGIPPMASAAPVPVPHTAAPAPAYRAPPAPVYAAPVPAPVPSLGSERLPSTVAAARRPENAVTAGVSAVTYDGNGRFTMTLDNGQVWRQLSGDQVMLHGTRFSSAHITRGALGSYDLTVDGRHASYRVTRLQ